MEPNLAFQSTVEVIQQEQNQLLDPSSRPDRYNVHLDISQFTEIVKLRGPENYDEWHSSICTAFQDHGVWDLVTGTEQPLLALDPPLSQTYKDWQRLDKSLSGLLGMTVERTTLASVPENLSIDAMYEFLRTNYKPKPGPQFSRLLQALSRLRLSNFSSIHEYGNKFITVQSEMEAVRPNAISQSVVNTLFLEGLGRDWESFKDRMADEEYATAEGPNLMLAELIVMAEAHEAILAETTIVTEPVKNRRGRPFCGHCNMVGHRQEGCWRMEGRSEEEITIIRRTLNQTRSRRARRAGGSLANRITTSSKTRRTANRISKR
ncbi:hypothetical protein N7528_007431 [Penicillium herquei]|nr:hypothetical protein N7528_007431 [Penicillium herquei]